ncbi:hypothetical protein ES705_10962 [subsurface metagenome]
MAGKKQANKTGQEKDRTPYWKQPWVECVMSGGYSQGDKLLFMRVLSFAPGYCSMTNETIMDELGCSRNTISDSITRLYKGGDLMVTGWNGHGRRLWAIKVPGVRENLQEWQKSLTKSGKVTDTASFLRKIRYRQMITTQKLGRNHPETGEVPPRNR